MVLCTKDKKTHKDSAPVLCVLREKFEKGVSFGIDAGNGFSCSRDCLIVLRILCFGHKLRERTIIRRVRTLSSTCGCLGMDSAL